MKVYAHSVCARSIVVELRTSMRVVVISNPAQTDMASAIVRNLQRLSSSLQTT